MLNLAISRQFIQFLAYLVFEKESFRNWRRLKMAFQFNFDLVEKSSPVFVDEATVKSSKVISSTSTAESIENDQHGAKLLCLDSPDKCIDCVFPSVSIEVQSNRGAVLNFLCVDPDRVELSDALASALEVEGITDLVDGVYEGGLKIWEGSLDLVKYIDSHQDIIRWWRKGKHSGHKRRVRNQRPLKALELGCGHGIPGIYVLKSPNRWSVFFSDFNEDVLSR
jgi:hypothetical protein